MNIKTIPCSLQNVDTIYQVGDIHIRNLKRHAEYKLVFNRLYKEIKKDTKNAMIVVTGDIVHSKLELSPESVNLAQSFFRHLADIAPTVVITGNHDCNLNNAARLDAIYPIVRALNHPNLFYLKDSGVYSISNLHFTVMSVFDRPVDYIKASDFDAPYKIALHHGAVDSALTDFGFKLTNKHVSTAMFDGYDLTLLGDIHKLQYLNVDKTIAYPGSLIQQNFGEGLSHGMLKWDVKSKKSEFIEIPNDYGYYTLEINNGVIPELTEISRNPRIRLKIQNTDSAQIKHILTEVKRKYNVTDISVQKINVTDSSNARLGGKLNFGDIRDPEYQNTLITDYIQRNIPQADEVILDGIRYINRILNTKLPSLQVTRNVIWKPKKFTFSNMFSYGEDNVIDFTSLKGLYGLFAANASGKSTLLDALAFCCFDKCSRTSKASHVLNNKKNSFSAEFNFELNGKDYFITRTGTRDKTGHVRVIVEFYYINEAGEKESLNGDERSDTNNNIRSYLGNYDDFVLTALSLQNNNTGFIDKSQKEKKELLSQFLDINIFEDLYALASEEIKSVSVLLKDYQKHDFSDKLVTAEKTIAKLTTEYNKLQKSKDKLSKTRDKLNAEILALTSKLKPIDTSILSLEELTRNKDSYKEQLEVELKKKIDTENQIKKISELIAKIQKDIEQIDTTELDNDWKQLILKETDLLKNTNLLQKIKVEIKHKLDKLKKLEEHKYDPNCDFCINNVFVKDAIQTKKQLKTDEDELKRLEQESKDIKKDIEGLIYSRADKESINTWCQELSKNQIFESQLQTKLHKVESLIKDYELEIEKINADIKSYLSQKDAIRFNDKINKEIDVLNGELNIVKGEIADEENSIIRVHGDIKVAEKIKIDSEEAIEKLKTLEREARGYEFYLEAIKRDGIPYELISTALPQIELEINNILAQIVDFNIILQTDGKNINAFIVYDDDNYWPLELTSGMEKFISSLAIRASLISVSNLPRPNFIAIDEGFGNLDNENLNSMYMLFDYLKTQFDFVIIISHLDVMRDVVDHLINITKVSGCSKMSYS